MTVIDIRQLTRNDLLRLGNNLPRPSGQPRKVHQNRPPATSTRLAHELSPDGSRYFGLLEVAPEQPSSEYGIVLGLRNSHDKTFPAGLALGSGVFVCDNLAFSAEVVIARRHTRFIDRDLPGLVQQAVARLGDLRIGQDRRIEAYRNTRLTDLRAHHLLIEAVRARVLPPTRIPEALQEWHEPRHAAFADEGRTAWRLFNACTEAVKGVHPDLLLSHLLCRPFFIFPAG